MATGSYQISWPDKNATPKSVLTAGGSKYICWDGRNIDEYQEGAVVDRHQGQTNAIYCDGHAKNVALSYLLSVDQREKNANGTPDPNGYLRQFTPDDD